MRDLICYTCSKCGGALTVEKTQEVMECPFCGNAFDYVFFHRGELQDNSSEDILLYFRKITDLIDHSKDQDKEYFAKVKRLFEILDRLWDKDEKSKPDSREISELNSEYEILRKKLVLEGNKGVADS